MAVNDNTQPADYDPRIPQDKSDVTEAGEYYAHIVTGRCLTHGLVASRCVHSIDGEGKTITDVECTLCRLTTK